MKKLIITLLFVMLLVNPITANAKTTKVAKPTYKATVTDDGTVKITVKSSEKKGKTYYREGVNFPTTKDNLVKSGDTLVFDIYSNATHVTLGTYVGKNKSSSVVINIDKLQEAKYESLLPDFVKNLTKGLNSDELKLKALWDWTMQNTEYAYTKSRKADHNYAPTHKLFFAKKSICHGFANLWADMMEVLGIKTVVINDDEMNHSFCLTKVKGKWFYVDTTHKKKETKESISYSFFLARDLYGKQKGYDTSSTRYILTFANGSTYNYFSQLNSVDGSDGEFLYDSVKDQYSFVWFDY